MAMKNIGFIGLGMMGKPMTACLAKAGFKLYLMDADQNCTDALVKEYGAQHLTKSTANELDMLITMLPNANIVEGVLLKDRWAAALQKNAVVMDMSSSAPLRSRALCSILAEEGLGYLDAPVSGGVRRAVDGKLAILVGGAPALLATCRPVLEAMGSSILHIGEAGAGHAAKALNNFVSAMGMMATVEALHVAKRFGISPDIMTDVLNASTGRSNTSENKVKQFMLNDSFASGFTLALMDKDLSTAAALADALGCPLHVGHHGVEIWHEVTQTAPPGTDHTEIYQRLGNEAET